MPRLHAGQEEIRRHPARYRIVRCGRRWGKSHLVLAIANGCAIERNLPVWWVWPSHVVAREAWGGRNGLLDWALQLRRAGFPIEISKVERAIRYPGGGSVAIRSADDPDSLVAAGLGMAVIDEAGLHQVRTWEESLRPALADHQGHAVFAGVPKGRQGLLWHVHQLAAQGGDWIEFHRQTSDSPLFPTAEWLAIERDHAEGRISDRYFRQEYLAEFVGEQGAVFERVLEAATAPGLSQRPAGAYIVVGIDWGRSHDATVFSAGNLSATPPTQIALERVVGRSYDEQKRRLADFCARWRPDLIVPERNAMGGPLCEEIAARYPTYFGEDGEPGFLTTPGSKRPLIEYYAHAFRTRQVQILPDPIQIAEHQSYEVRQLTSGHVQFSASSHGHDDTVMAGALWYSQVSQDVDWGCAWA